MNKLVITNSFFEKMGVNQRERKKLPNLNESMNIKKSKNRQKFLEKNNLVFSRHSSSPFLPNKTKFLKKKYQYFKKEKKKLKSIFDSSLNMYLKKFHKHKKIPSNSNMTNYKLISILKKFPESEKSLLKLIEEPFLKTIIEKKNIEKIISQHTIRDKKYNLVRKKIQNIHKKNIMKRINFIDKKKNSFKNLKIPFKTDSFTNRNIFDLQKIKENDYNKKSKNLKSFKKLKKNWISIDKVSRNKYIGFKNFNKKIYLHHSRGSSKLCYSPSRFSVWN